MNCSSFDFKSPVDVVVVGAGVSGVPAAVAAARAGAKTLLIDQSRHFGGVLHSGLGFPVCGLFESDTVAPPRLLNEGLTAEWFAAVSGDLPDPVVAMGRVYVCLCPPSLFDAIYGRWLNEKNLTFCMGIRDLRVQTVGNRIEEIGFTDWSGKVRRVATGQVVDCTASGEVIRQSGAGQIQPERLPLAGFSVRLKEIQPSALLRLRVPYVLRKAVEEGRLPASCAFTAFHPESGGEALCKFSFPDGTAPHEACRTVEAALSILRENIPEFSRAGTLAFSPAVLSREGARLKGRMILTADDVRTGRRFNEVVARGGWPMEYWDASNGVQYRFVENGFSYDIPAGVLRSENIENLHAAGRLLSADSGALASARVMGTAMATGEAAGRAAAKEMR